MRTLKRPRPPDTRVGCDQTPIPPHAGCRATVNASLGHERRGRESRRPAPRSGPCVRSHRLRTADHTHGLPTVLSMVHTTATAGTMIPMGSQKANFTGRGRGRADRRPGEGLAGRRPLGIDWTSTGIRGGLRRDIGGTSAGILPTRAGGGGSLRPCPGMLSSGVFTARQRCESGLPGSLSTGDGPEGWERSTRGKRRVDGIRPNLYRECSGQIKCSSRC